MWPERFSKDKDAFSAYDASSKRYYEYKKKVSRLRGMEQSLGASSADSSSVRDAKRTAVGGSSAGSAAPDGSAAGSHAPPAGGPHDSPPDVARTNAGGLQSGHDLAWFQQIDWNPDADTLGMSELEWAEFCVSREQLAPGDSWNF